MVRLTLALLVVALASCGQSEHRERSALRPGAKHEARLLHDIELIRAAARETDTSTLQGTPALRRTTTRFLDDLARSGGIPRLRKNRLIDHAAGALGGTCEQCFQQLEAVRPIVTR
jgi:hypothetical protein